jgi:hypothetical protein
VDTNNEQAYYSNLWKIINQKSSDYSAYGINSQGNAVLDSSALAQFIMEKYPKLVRNTIPHTVYTIPKTPFSEQLSYFFLNRANKGLCISLKDKNGNDIILVNAGDDSSARKKRILTIKAPTLDNMGKLQDRIKFKVLKNDIEYVTRRNLRQKVNKPMAAILVSTSRNETTPKGNFEKHFKALMQEQGHDASPRVAAEYLLSTMPYTEKRKLNTSLVTMGIKTREDMEKLLHKWKAEALKGIAAPKVSRTKVMEMEYGR